MKFSIVFAVLAVFAASSWTVDCAPYQWSSSSSSSTNGGNTITETNVNGHRQVFVNGQPVGPGNQLPPGMNVGQGMGPMGMPNMGMPNMGMPNMGMGMGMVMGMPNFG